MPLLIYLYLLENNDIVFLVPFAHPGVLLLERIPHSIAFPFPILKDDSLKRIVWLSQELSNTRGLEFTDREGVLLYPFQKKLPNHCAADPFFQDKLTAPISVLLLFALCILHIGKHFWYKKHTWNSTNKDRHFTPNLNIEGVKNGDQISNWNKK